MCDEYGTASNGESPGYTTEVHDRGPKYAKLSIKGENVLEDRLEREKEEEMRTQGGEGSCEWF